MKLISTIRTTGKLNCLLLSMNDYLLHRYREDNWEGKREEARDILQKIKKSKDKGMLSLIMALSTYDMEDFIIDEIFKMEEEGLI